MPALRFALGILLGAVASPVAVAQVPQLSSSTSGSKFNGFPTCADFCPDGQDCSARTNSGCVDVAGPVGGVGMVIGKACSDYGFLSARAAAYHGPNQDMGYRASAGFWDYLTLQGGTGLAVVSVSFQTIGTRSGDTTVEADYNLGAAGTNVILSGSADSRTLSVVVAFGSPFELHGGLGVSAAGCGDPVDGDADFSLQVSGFAITDTNGVTLTNVIVFGSSGTPYIGCSQPPVILTNPASVCTCESAAATMSVTVANPPWGGFTYHWRRSGTPIPGATDSKIASSMLADPGTYDVVITNSCGSVTSSPALVYSPLTYGMQSDGGLVLDWCNPADVLMTSTNLASWTDLTKAFPPFVVPASVAQAQFFRLRCGGRLPTFLSQPPSGIISAGSNFTFTAQLAGQPPFAYQWLLNGTNIPNATNATLQVIGAGEAQVGAYQLLVSNLYGSTLSLSGYLALSNDTGGLALNTVLANPQVSVLLIGGYNNGGLPLNTTIASPAPSVLLVGGYNTGGLPLNTTIAAPTPSVLLIGANNSGGLPANTTIGQPPAIIELSP